MRRARAVDGRGQHLVAVGDEQQQIRPPRSECIGQAQNGKTDGFGHSGVGVGAEQALDARLNGKAVALDLVQRVSELRREMRAESEDAQLDFRTAGKLAQRPIEMTVVGARGGDDADATPRSRRSRLRAKSIRAFLILGRNHRRSIN